MARIFFESRDLAGTNRRRLVSFDREGAPGDPSGDFLPPIDVFDSDAGIEILMDLPGVSADAVTIVLKDGVLRVSGAKPPTRCRHGHTAFHLAERGFGRFARAVQLSAAVDARQASATFAAGELRILLPRLAERRGEEIRIRIQGKRTDPGGAAGA